MDENSLLITEILWLWDDAICHWREWLPTFWGFGIGDITYNSSEDAGYHYMNGITGALLSGGAPTNDYRWEEWIVTNEKVTKILKRYYYMLFPKELKENEYVCLFLVKTDKDGNPVVDKDFIHKII